MPARTQQANGVADSDGEALAANVADLTRLPEIIRDSTLRGPDGAWVIDRTPIRTDPDRPDEAAVRLTCPLLRAAAVLDVIRNHDRRCGDHPTRVYLRQARAWERLPRDAVLTEVVDGKIVLNPAIFRTGRTLAAAEPPPPQKIAFGRRV